jgi:hypothetical protein
MAYDLKGRLEAIDGAVLTPLVRRALRSDSIEVGDWRYEPLHMGGGRMAGVIGLVRFSGQAREQGEQVSTAWSMVLKAFRGAEGGDSNEITGWDYWKREILAYESGLLEDLPAGLRAPHCYGITEHPGPEYWVWLEDLGDELDAAWSLEQCGQAARFLGRFNGVYLAGKPLPTLPWLSQGRVREWLDGVAPVAEELECRRDEPVVRRLLGGGRLARTLELWSERERLLAGLDRLPRCLCHHDAFCRNLMLRRGSDGQEGLVGIDWAMVGTGAVGEEIAPMVGVSLQFMEVDIKYAQELDRRVLEGYLAGLRDAGWQGDARLVRFGYAAATAMMLGLGSLWYVNGLVEQPALVEGVFGHSIDVIVDRLAALQGFLLDLGDEARALVHVLEFG